MVASAESVATLSPDERRIRRLIRQSLGKVERIRGAFGWIRKWSVPILASFLLTVILSKSIVKWDTSVLNKMIPFPTTKGSGTQGIESASTPPSNKQSPQSQSPGPNSTNNANSQASQAAVISNAPAPTPPQGAAKPLRIRPMGQPHIGLCNPSRPHMLSLGG